MHNYDIMFQIIKNAIEMYKRTDFDYVLICDDDFYPIDNFLEQLNKTVELLPNDWRSLHLCPGFLWGRLFRDISPQGHYFRESSQLGHARPEYDMNNFAFHPSGRFFLNCNNKAYFDSRMWLGGPIAILLNKKTCDDYLHHFIQEYTNSNQKISNDAVFTKMLNDNDYICREPLLGYENEEGGTSFKW